MITKNPRIVIGEFFTKIYVRFCALLLKNGGRSISRVMSLHGHLSRTCVAASLKRPTWNRRAALRSFAVLLRMGFTWLLALPSGRWSLEPPFHPYLSKTGGISLLHWPWSYLRRPLAGILPCEARTFLPHSLSALVPAAT